MAFLILSFRLWEDGLPIASEIISEFPTKIWKDIKNFLPQNPPTLSCGNLMSYNLNINSPCIYSLARVWEVTGPLHIHIYDLIYNKVSFQEPGVQADYHY